MWPLLDYIYISLVLGIFIIVYLAVSLPLYAIERLSRKHEN